MKKRRLTPKELQKVLELRHLGAKWTEIEEETHVERRAAKRAYEEWVEDKRMKEQEAVRFRVAAEAFHEHLNDLIALAESLVGALAMPQTLRGLIGADDVLDQFWIRNVHDKLEENAISNDRKERLVRSNKMLFKSLQDHTKEKVRWEVLEEWKQARDNTIKYSEELGSEAINIIGEILNKRAAWKESIEIVTGSKNINQTIAEGARENIWQSILTRKQEQMQMFKGTSALTQGHYWLEFYKGDEDRKFYLDDQEIVKEVLHICQQGVTKIREVKSDLVQKLTDEVRRMEDRTKQMEGCLNALVLCPIILRTKCDLCPA